MTAQSQFYLLNEHMGWRQASSTQVHTGSELALYGRPDGPLGLTNPDGSLGHLVLPRRMALAENGILFLIPTSDPAQILRYDPKENAFLAVSGIGGSGADARNFGPASSLAITGKSGSQLLYVLDSGKDRVQVFHLASLALLHLFSLYDLQPVDLAAWKEWVFFLFRKGDQHRVYRHNVSGEQLELVFETSDRVRWERIAVDREGRIYLLNQSDPENVTLDVCNPQQLRSKHQNPSSESWEHIGDSGAVSSRFDPPAVIIQSDPRPDSPYHRGIFQLNLQGCHPEAPLDASSSWFDRNGQRVEFHPDQFLEPRAYYAEGEWISQALDSKLFRCQWHRVELFLTDFPPGTHVLISTFSSPDPTLPVRPLWQKSYEAVGSSDPAGGGSNDFLIQSRPGQYLWLKIEISGDGYGTPGIRGMHVHFPRQSYLAYLPAIYSEENSRWFLERFISIFQTDWDELEARIGRFAGLFDPAAVSSTDGSLDNLANWMALPLEAEWDEEQKKRLLQIVAKYYPRRGTQAGLRAFVQVYLQNMTSLTPKLQAEFPVFIEGFRRRSLESFLLSHREIRPASNGSGREGDRAAAAQPGSTIDRTLWGPGKVGRLQLNRYSKAGEARLVSTGDPQLDVFHEYAHRFQVFIPSAWICTAEDEQRLRRSLDAEKPIQTAYELYLVEPRFRVGIQSTVGVDTILGNIPRIVLGSSSKQVNANIPPSRAPSGRLGYDTVLAARPGALPVLPVQAGGLLQLP